MSIEVHVPTLGESIVDAVIARWLKHEGDTVTQGEALVELETDKVNVEVTADQSGVLQKIARQEGETVAVGDVLGVIGTERPQRIAPTGQSGELQPGKAGQVVSERQKTPSGQLASDGRVAQRPPSPLARRIAAEYNIDLSQVKGSSPHGRVTKDDVVSFMAQQAGEGSVYRVERSEADIAMGKGYQAKVLTFPQQPQKPAANPFAIPSQAGQMKQPGVQVQNNPAIKNAVRSPIASAVSAPPSPPKNSNPPARASGFNMTLRIFIIAAIIVLLVVIAIIVLLLSRHGHSSNALHMNELLFSFCSLVLRFDTADQ